MKTRLLVLTLLGLSTPRAAAQESAPPPAPPAAPVSAAPVSAAPVSATPPVPAASAPQPGTSGWADPSADTQPAPPPAVQPAAPPSSAELPAPQGQVRSPYPPPHAGSRYRLPPPRLYPIEPRASRPESPRRYGDAGAPFAFGIGGSLLWYPDDGYKMVYDGKYGGALDAFASYDVWTPVRNVVIAAGLSLRNERHESTELFDYRQNTIQAELTARWVTTSWFSPHLRAAVGAVVTHFESSDELARIDYEDRATGLASTFGAGFTLRTPSRLFETHNGRLSSLSLGVLVEGGYTLASAAKLSAEPTESGDLTRATFAVGKLDRSAPYLRIMGVLRF